MGIVTRGTGRGAMAVGAAGEVVGGDGIGVTMLLRAVGGVVLTGIWVRGIGCTAGGDGAGLGVMIICRGAALDGGVTDATVALGRGGGDAGGGAIVRDGRVTTGVGADAEGVDPVLGLMGNAGGRRAGGGGTGVASNGWAVGCRLTAIEVRKVTGVGNESAESIVPTLGDVVAVEVT